VDHCCSGDGSRTKGGCCVLAIATERNMRYRYQPFGIRNRKRTRVWTTMRRGSGLAVDQRTDLSRGANDNVIATDIGMRGETITRIINIYHQRNTQSGERPAQHMNSQRVIRQGGTIVYGTLTPIAYDGTQDAKCSGMLHSGKT